MPLMVIPADEMTVIAINKQTGQLEIQLEDVRHMSLHLFLFLLLKYADHNYIAFASCIATLYSLDVFRSL